MRVNKALVAAIGLSMVATPVLAQSAAPLSITRSAAVMEGASHLDDDGYLLPGIVLVAILAAAILFSKSQGSEPTSP